MRLHQFFVYVIKELIDDDFKNSEECKRLLYLYEKLDVKPHHIHRLKCEQKTAIFILSTCLAKFLYKKMDIPKNLPEKFEENALKHLRACRKDIE